jgi:hypothetical protein
MIGQAPVEEPYLLIGKIATFFYFFYFFILYFIEKIDAYIVSELKKHK